MSFKILKESEVYQTVKYFQVQILLLKNAFAYFHIWHLGVEVETESKKRYELDVNTAEIKRWREITLTL